MAIELFLPWFSGCISHVSQTYETTGCLNLPPRHNVSLNCLETLEKTLARNINCLASNHNHLFLNDNAMSQSGHYNLQYKSTNIFELSGNTDTHYTTFRCCNILTTNLSNLKSSAESMRSNNDYFY